MNEFKLGDEVCVLVHKNVIRKGRVVDINENPWTGEVYNYVVYTGNLKDNPLIECKCDEVYSDKYSALDALILALEDRVNELRGLRNE